MGHLNESAARLRSATTAAEFIQLLHETGISMLDLRFADLPGRWHHVTLPVATLSLATFEGGVGFDGSSVPGFKTVERGDMVLIPDRTTANLDPFADEPTVFLLCTVAEADTREIFERDPRVIASRAAAALRDSGHADTSLWSPELEFYIFTSVDYAEADEGSYYSVESLEAGWYDPEERTNPGYRIAPRRGYHAIPPIDRTWDLRNEMTVAMLEAGIPVKYHHHENGAPGQVEIEVLAEPLVAAADNLMLGKYIVRNTADAWGAAATFMPKPLATESGNGMHFHVRLERDGQPVFYDESGYAGLSEKALFFIGGILEHGRALTAITNPSTNSYRRLRPGFEAPTNLFFSAANRSAAIRIPGYATEPDTKTIEYRPSDATGNPYLTMAALLSAGLDGMERRIDPTTNGHGPFDVDLHSLPEAERSHIVPLPARLEEALTELREDSGFLTATGVFPRGFVDAWIEQKAQEAEEVRTRPHPTEYRLFFDC